MNVDISFDFAKIFNIQKWVHVVKGQKFSLFTDAEGEIKFFTDNDPVLNLSPTGPNVDIEATELGDSTLLILDNNFSVIKEIVFSVVSSINPAEKLGLTADAAVSK